MVNKVRKEPRTVTTVNLDNRIIEWMRSRPRSFAIQDWINDTLRKNIKTIEEAQKRVRLQELKAEMAEKTLEIAKLEQEATQKQVDEELKAKAEAQYAIEQREIQDLQDTLQFWRKQGDEFKTFLVKLEYDKRDTLPKDRLPRLRAIKAELDRACVDGLGRELLERMKARLAHPN